MQTRSHTECLRAIKANDMKISKDMIRAIYVWPRLCKHHLCLTTSMQASRAPFIRILRTCAFPFTQNTHQPVWILVPSCLPLHTRIHPAVNPLIIITYIRIDIHAYIRRLSNGVLLMRVCKQAGEIADLLTDVGAGTHVNPIGFAQKFGMYVYACACSCMQKYISTIWLNACTSISIIVFQYAIITWCHVLGVSSTCIHGNIMFLHEWT
jgi:hypothetical protein